MLVIRESLALAVALLVSLVSLAGEHDHVTGTCFLDRARDSLAAVEDHVAAWVAALAHARDDCSRDREGVLGTRIVVRDHDAVGEPPRDVTHVWTLAWIAVAAAAEDAN